jgi:alkylation response protein AidB-like acyl-CoA dehydrogenase
MALLSRRDISFMLYEWLDIERLTGAKRYAEHSRETFDAVIDVAEAVAAEHFAPHNRLSDENEPRFDGERVQIIPEVKQALERFAETGLLASTFAPELGGADLPITVATVCFGMFKAANVATTAYFMLSAGNAGLLAAFASDELAARYVPALLEGRFHGTMCLSEPAAGSSLADITTRAVPADDGSYRVFGNKMWISGGDHELGENIVHLVLAKIPGGGPGVKGISLLAVPKYLPDGSRNDVVLAGLNHKMGFRGTTNALLNFGEGKHRPGGEPGAVGFLVGEPHRGLSYMFQMMNEARLGVGAGAMALGYTAYLKAVDYARTRVQGRAFADPKGPQVPIVQHADVRRMLLAAKSYVEGGLALCLYTARLADEARAGEARADEARAGEPGGQRERAGELLELLTPIVKSWPSQWCLAANDLAIQVHGGYGYSRDFDVEQHYRDNRLNSIHEGTHGIQALDLLGRKAVAGGGAALDLLLERVNATVAAARGTEWQVAAQSLGAAASGIAEVTGVLWSDGPAGAELALANATVYLEALGHIVVAWLWLEQALAAEGKAGDFYDGKRQAARYFLHWELPKTAPRLDLLRRRDRIPLDTHPDWL